MAIEPRIRVIGPRVYLTRPHFVLLFGEGRHLEFEEALGLQGGFLARQSLSAATALERLDDVPVVGPLGGFSGLVCPRSKARALGLDPPVRAIGDFEGSPGLTLIGPRGHLELEAGVICPLRTLHLSPENARRLGLLHQDRVACLVRSDRRLELREAVRDGILAEVDVCVSDEYDLELHLDEDEADALRALPGGRARVLTAGDGRPPEERYLPVGRLVSEDAVRRARAQNLRIKVSKGMVLTPSAKDLGRAWGLFDFEE